MSENNKNNINNDKKGTSEENKSVENKQTENVPGEKRQTENKPAENSSTENKPVSKGRRDALNTLATVPVFGAMAYGVY